MRHPYFRAAAALLLSASLLTSCSVILIDPSDTAAALPDAGAVTAAETESRTAADDTPSGTESTALPDDGSLSGQACSAQSDKLRLVLDYRRTKGPDGQDSLLLTVSLSSYSLSVGERPDLGKLTVGGDCLTFSTPAMEITENTVRTTTVLLTHTAAVPSGEAVAVSVSWPFNGVYAGVELTDLTVSCTVPG